MELKLFFDERAALFLNKRNITLRDLCYMSGRDYRVWTDPVYSDMIDSIEASLNLNSSTTLLEVGCAAGFLAKGLSPRVLRYCGVDISPVSLKLARRLNLPNAEFRLGDAAKLPFPSGQFDRAICYDVFTNFNDPDFCAQVISEMARVVRSGGIILIGSVPDCDTEDAYTKRVAEVGQSLPPFVEDPDVTSRRWMPWYYRLYQKVYSLAGGTVPDIVCYYFDRTFFIEVGERLGLRVEILPIHKLNPYVGYRYNVLFKK